MQRAIGLRGAVAINVITMIGIGPLVTIPLVLAALGGPLALIGWLAGAIVAICDGLVWAELASRYPGSGGTYVYLREIFGSRGFGRALAFLFNWQFLLYAPCLLASGYIGFANYAAYLFPAIGTTPWLHDAVAVGVGSVTIGLLYRSTSRVSGTSIILAIASLLTLAFVSIAAFSHAHIASAFHLDTPLRFGSGLLAGFASALYITLYDYVGYADAALLGDEIRQPNRTIPRAIVYSIVVVAAFYLTLQIGVLSAVPWRSLLDAHGMPTAQATYIGSFIVERIWGSWPARAVTLLVLVTAFASVYGNLLGFSRIPYAAARDGNFFPIFAKIDPRREIPSVAILAIGALSLIASFFSLDQVIAILTAGIVLIQAIAQIVALAVMRVRGTQAPFRMPLYPLPALLALTGWVLAFLYTGPLAITLGITWLVIGIAAFFLFLFIRRTWPIVLLLCIFACATNTPASAADTWATWNTSQIVRMSDTPVFTVDGKPFFVYGVAFFYERIPRAAWRSQLEMYRSLGVNTIDLYLIWNWHEPDEHTTDFTGSTNPERDLRTLFTEIHRLGFKVIVRPGPVIRNEWKNGGYPDWLLKRPEYNMPLHDILEGRYPATATFQNAHADAAAAEWLANPTHLGYAGTWLHDVLQTIEPWSHDVIAIALDDDQGAYIDNDTWPAPHWQTYIEWLRSKVQATTGTRIPLFINTYQMKVTASSPVWAWGNWYQSDAYRLGDHDLSQLAFSTGLLQTQPGVPVMASEFQAGWLQGADEIAPRPAAPENTTLALHEMLQYGMHGVVNFPLQDTLNPFGWEAPWANWFYAWDAALDLQGYRSARAAPSQAFGNLVRSVGPFLATLHPASNISIAWLASAYDPVQMNNARIAHLAELTIAAQAQCRTRALACRVVDLRYIPFDELLQTKVLVLPTTGFPLPFDPSIDRVLSRFRNNGGIVTDTVADAHVRSTFPGLRDATLLISPDGHSGVLDIFNASQTVHRTPSLRVALAYSISIPPMTISAGAARVVLLNMPLQPYASTYAPDDRLTSTCTIEAIGSDTIVPSPMRDDACDVRLAFAKDVYRFHFAPGFHGAIELFPKPHTASASVIDIETFASPPPHGTPADVPINERTHALLPSRWSDDEAIAPARAYTSDVYRNGEDAIVLENDRIRVVVAPNAGARAFLFEDLATQRNYFTTIGAARDGVENPPAASLRDYIAPYTHPIDAGTFNRPYACAILESGVRAVVRCTYDAPDLGSKTVHFEKIFTLDPDTTTLDLDVRSSENATLLSAVSSDSTFHVNVPSDVRLDESARKAFRLLTIHYRAHGGERILFSLQGAVTDGANRR